MPVRPSPQEVARQEEKQPVPAKHKSLVEKFAQQMGGVEPSKMLSTLKATAFKLPDKRQGQNYVPQEVSNEQMMALLVVANNYGLNPFIKEIYAFPDKGGIVPIVGVDGWSRMINDHAQFDGMKFELGGDLTQVDAYAKTSHNECTCIIYRKDRTYPIEVTEYLDEVYRPKFKPDSKPGPWQTHTKRMLRHKAMIQCARLAFGFTGVHDQDEAERIVQGEYIPADDQPTQAETLSDRFGKQETEPNDHPDGRAEKPPQKGDIEDGEFSESENPTPPEEPEPEPKTEEPEPTPEPEAPPKDQTQDFLNRLMEASSEDVINEVLTEVAETNLPAAKKTVIRKAAKGMLAGLTGD